MYCGETVGCIKIKLDMEVGLGPGDIVLDGDPGPLPENGHSSPHFSAHVYCGQTAQWIKTSLGMEVGLGPGNMAWNEAHLHANAILIHPAVWPQ